MATMDGILLFPHGWHGSHSRAFGWALLAISGWLKQTRMDNVNVPFYVTINGCVGKRFKTYRGIK
jgi:hypothetical protein